MSSNKAPLFSIIIPVYNVEKYIGDCLDSVLKQTVSDWEVLCVDDGSTDSSAHILSRYEQQDRRFKVISQKNQGVSVARNTGLQNARGEFIVFLDSDDELAPDFLNQMHLALTDTHADLAYCHYRQGKNPPTWNSTKIKYNIYNQLFDRFIDDHFDEACAIWGKMYRRELIRHFSFNPDLKIGEDVLFLHQILYKAKSAVYISHPLYFYRIRENSAIHQALTQTIIDGNVQTAIEIAAYFKNKKMAAKTKHRLNQKISKRIFKFCIMEPKRKDNAHIAKWYAYTRPLLARLKSQHIYKPEFLNWYNRLKSWIFLQKGHIK